MSRTPPRTARALRIALIVGVAVAALAAGVWFNLQRLAPAPAAADATRMLFSQTLADAAGQPHALSQQRGKILVVNFWATWCAPCVEEIPEFSRLRDEYVARAAGADRPTAPAVEFIGLGIDSADNIAAFVKKVPASYPLLVAGMGGTELSRLFGDTVGGLPYTVVLDADGAVRASKMGRVTEAELRAWLKPLVGR